MLPRPEAPARRLPYTTADMSERLAKRKAEQANQALRFGVTNPPAPAPEPKKSGGGWLSQVGNMAKSLVLTPAGTALDMIPYVANIPGVKGEGAWGYEPEDIGTSNFFQAGGQALEQSTRHLVGDVTAIPGLGKDSPSYTADQIRKYGVAEGLASAGLDYGNLALTAAPFVKPTGMAIGNAINDAKYAAYLRRTKSPFPDIAPPKPGTFIDVAEGSRLPARVVESPTNPAMQLAESQTQRALPAAEIAATDVAPATAKLSSPAFRERPVPARSRLTLEESGNSVYVRAFDDATNEYVGVITLAIDRATNQVHVTGLSSKSPTLTTQLIAAAANEARKVLGDVPYPLTPSTNLSMYSRPFVERLQQAGLIDPNYQLPAIDSINTVNKSFGPSSFVSSTGRIPQEVINPLSYQPTYNDVLKALVESKRQATLEGKGRLSTPSKEVQKIKNASNVPGTTELIYNAITQRYRLYGLNMTEHPVLERLSNGELDQLVADINHLPGDGVTAIEKLIQDTDLSSIQNYDPFLPADADVFRISESVATYMWQQRLINRLTYERLRNQISNRYYNSQHDTNGL